MTSIPSSRNLVDVTENKADPAKNKDLLCIIALNFIDVFSWRCLEKKTIIVFL